MRVYGIKNCASVKKALTFFDDNNICYELIDISKNPISKEHIEYWLTFGDAKEFFNPRSKAFKDKDLKGKNLNTKTRVKLLWEENSIIKRPVIEHGLNGEEKLYIGFNEEDYSNTFLQK